MSPALLTAHDLELSVPGTYSAAAPIVRIMSFCPSIDVIASKQRPRKVILLGSDGRAYTFLLKGHEDLRQDERCMQLFGLVNTLLANDGDTSRRDLSIRRYAVTPLSHDAGVVGWVPNCDTMHALIREYREARSILLNIEHRLMLQMAPQFDHLTVLQRVEAFRYSLENTTGGDLSKVLWLKSSSSEVWLERRTAFTRSLAVMSAVGYVLGLGDRHPSNLMLDRLSGKILHIDFGDCFEVAMTRDKFPERVPFRLTRMLVNAMEAAGCEGNYRSTMESVMRVLRANKDSVTALLEAFVHDPLINWRLLTAGPGPVATTAGGPANDGAAGAAATAVAAAGGAMGGIPGSFTPTRRLQRATSVVAGAERIAENNPEARTLVQTGLLFAKEVEDAALATAVAATGFDPHARVPGGGSNLEDAAVATALARSLAASMSIRGDRVPRIDPSLAGAGAGAGGTGMDAGASEVINERAVAVIRRIQAKLAGRDFAEDDPISKLMGAGVGLEPGHGNTLDGDRPGTLDVPSQIHRLIAAATSHENLAQVSHVYNACCHAGNRRLCYRVSWRAQLFPLSADLQQFYPALDLFTLFAGIHRVVLILVRSAATSVAC